MANNGLQENNIKMKFFTEDLYSEYNQKLKISFLHKIRDQIKFSSKSDLIKQMDYDYKIAMELTEKLKNEL